MDNITKIKVTRLLNEYLEREIINGDNRSITPQLEEITLTGKEFVEILSKILPKNYVSKRERDKYLNKFYDFLEAKAYQSLR